MGLPYHQIIVTPENIHAFIVIHDASMAFTENSIPHWHEELELICTLDSRINVRRDHEHFTVNENDLVLIESGQIHTSIPIQGYANHCISIAFKREFLQKYGMHANGNHFDINGNSEAKVDIIRKMKILDQLYREKEPKRYQELQVNALLFSIAYSLLANFQCAHSPEPKTATLKYRERYRSIVQYMQEHYNESITLDDLARHANLSREYLSREFKQYIGEGFREHLSNIRIMKAQNDLLNSDLTLMEIAIKHGFNDLRSYNRAFEKHFGVSPAQHRRNQKRKQNIPSKKDSLT